MSTTDTDPCVQAGEHQITQRHGLHECPTNGLATEEGQGLALAMQLFPTDGRSDLLRADTERGSE